jgi:hypothetical protein
MALKRRITVAISAVFIRFAVKRDCNRCFFFSPVSGYRYRYRIPDQGPFGNLNPWDWIRCPHLQVWIPFLESGPVVTTSVVDPEVVPDLHRF